jgi:hypothetical protein
MTGADMSSLHLTTDGAGLFMDPQREIIAPIRW